MVEANIVDVLKRSASWNVPVVLGVRCIHLKGDGRNVYCNGIMVLLVPFFLGGKNYYKRAKELKYYIVSHFEGL